MCNIFFIQSCVPAAEESSACVAIDEVRSESNENQRLSPFDETDSTAAVSRPVTHVMSPVRRVDSRVTIALPHNCLETETSLIDASDDVTPPHAPLALSCDVTDAHQHNSSALGAETDRVASDVSASHVSRSGSFNTTTFGDLNEISLREISRLYSDVINAQHESRDESDADQCELTCNDARDEEASASDVIVNSDVTDVAAYRNEAVGFGQLDVMTSQDVIGSSYF